MYLRRLRLENVYGFERLDLDLTHADGAFAGWTVLAGPNGSGKTSALRAMGIVLRGPPSVPSMLDPRRFGAHIASASAEIVVEADDRFVDDARSDAVVPLTWGFPTGGYASVTPPWVGTHTALTKGSSLGVASHGLGWFAAGYGPYRRLYGPEDVFTMIAQRETDVVGLFAEGASIAEGVAGLMRLNYRRQDERTPQDEKARLKALEDACLDLVSALLVEANLKVVGVGPDGLIARRGEREISLARFSDGQRVVAALVVDLVMRMSSVFGERFEYDRQQRVVPHTGVVLIDEVEAHLHPTWQRRIGPLFKRHFPAVQFIVTTHSPFICQAADRGALLRVSATPDGGGEVERVSDETWREVAFGSIDDAVVGELFEVRSVYSDEAERDREEAARLEVENRRGRATPEDRARLSRLLENLPHNDDTAIDLMRRRTEKLA